jgi:hypothetical protein
MGSHQKREEAWLKKYGKALHVGGGANNISSDRLPPISQHQQQQQRAGGFNGGGIPPMFQARGPIKSFPAVPSISTGGGKHQSSALSHPDRSHNPSKLTSYQPILSSPQAMSKLPPIATTHASPVSSKPTHHHLLSPNQASPPLPYPPRQLQLATTEGQQYTNAMSPDQEVAESPLSPVSYGGGGAGGGGGYGSPQLPGNKGRDLQMELIVLKAIKGRDDTLDRLRTTCEKLDEGFGGLAPMVLSQVRIS